jgi:DNA segregation ATPase FtsK/SpoIIIE-like protein
MDYILIIAIAGGVAVVAGLAAWLILQPRPRPIASPGPEPAAAPPDVRDRPVDAAVAHILEAAASRPGDARTAEDMLDEALKVVTAIGGVSVPALQRKLGIDFGRATDLVELMEARGFVSDVGPSHKRKVLPAAFEHVEALAGEQ